MNDLVYTRNVEGDPKSRVAGTSKLLVRHAKKLLPGGSRVMSLFKSVALHAEYIWHVGFACNVAGWKSVITRDCKGGVNIACNVSAWEFFVYTRYLFSLVFRVSFRISSQFCYTRYAPGISVSRVMSVFRSVPLHAECGG